MRLNLNPPKPFKGDSYESKLFLRKLHKYLRLCRVAPSEQVEMTATFLEGAPDKLWDTESELLLANKSSLSWHEFESFIERKGIMGELLLWLTTLKSLRL